jgi:hypothetical protein
MPLPFPILPVLIGAAIGAAVTYVLTSRSAKKQIADALDDVGETLGPKAKRAASSLSDTVDAATDTAKEAVSRVRKS